MRKISILKTGAAAVTVLALLVGVGVAVAETIDDGGATSGTGGDGYCANMPDAVGLYVGNPVTQMGFRVGKITSIDSAGDHVRVNFALDDGRTYPADVQAVTRSKSLLADRSLELVGNYRSGPSLRPGTCIALDHSFTPKSISEIAGSAADFIDSLTNSGRHSVQHAIHGLDVAMSGIGPSANEMLRHAAAAAGNPDKFVADIGSAISDMAPLTTDALANWDQIMSIVEQMPAVTTKATTLFDYVSRFDRGVGWVVATIYDIQRNYGDDILWPLMQGPVTQIIHAAAARAPELRDLYAMVPSIAAAMRQQTAAGGLSVPYRAPSVTLRPAQCRALGPVCVAGRTTSMNLLSLIVATGAR